MSLVLLVRFAGVPHDGAEFHSAHPSIERTAWDAQVQACAAFSSAFSVSPPRFAGSDVRRASFSSLSHAAPAGSCASHTAPLRSSFLCVVFSPLRLQSSLYFYLALFPPLSRLFLIASGPSWFRPWQTTQRNEERKGAIGRSASSGRGSNRDVAAESDSHDRSVSVAISPPEANRPEPRLVYLQPSCKEASQGCIIGQIFGVNSFITS